MVQTIKISGSDYKLVEKPHLLPEPPTFASGNQEPDQGIGRNRHVGRLHSQIYVD